MLGLFGFFFFTFYSFNFFEGGDGTECTFGSEDNLGELVLSPSIRWVLGIKLRLSGWVRGVFAY